MIASDPRTPVSGDVSTPTGAGGASDLGWIDAFGLSFDLWQVQMAGADGIRRRAEQRLQRLVAHAVARSPFYRDLYAGVLGVSNAPVPLAALPAVRKADLMAAFDDWVTDPACNRAAVAAHLADPSRIGMPLAGRYAVWTSSGTTALPGWFVHDARAVTIAQTLFAVRACPAATGMLAQLAFGARSALVAAVDGHFAGITLWRRGLQQQAWLKPSTEAFSALQPVPALCAALQRFDPRLLTGYPSVLSVLADAQRGGRLGLRLAGIWSGGESLPAPERDDIAAAFGCPVIDDYGASEFPTLAYDCGHGALHLNADWVILEPVDATLAPVPPGTASSTVLLTNLANFAQPLIRYDLGDSVTLLPGRCPCGSALPAMHVQGRRDDTLWLAGRDGAAVPLLPLSVATVLEEGCDVWRFQLLQQRDTVNGFVLRVDGEGAARQESWARTARRFAAYCDEQGAVAVTIDDDGQPPQPEPVSGKLRRIRACVAGSPRPTVPI